MADGWAIKRIYDTPLRDIYIAQVQAGAALPRHYKAQMKRIYVVSGGVTVQLDGGEVTAVNNGNVYAVMPNTPHTITGGSGDSLLIVVYEPPFMPVS